MAPLQWVGATPATVLARMQIREAAPTDLSVLIAGEPGTGRQLAARTLHTLSPRHDGPFVHLYCGSLHPAQAAVALFGGLTRQSGSAGRPEPPPSALRPVPSACLHRLASPPSDRGADAEAGGALADAAGGTLFLDEVGQLPPAVQQQLLAHLRRPGAASQQGGASARVVASSSVDLAHAARAGQACPELFYRLAIVPVRLDPLRERLADLPLLALHFARQLGIGAGATPVSRQAVGELEAYRWPGNVWELKCLFRRAAVLFGSEPLTAGRVRDLLAEAAWTHEPPPGSAGRSGALWSNLAGRN